MTIERTLSIIKPDATGSNLTGEINALIEKAGLRIIAQKRVRWTMPQAQKFYGEHKGRPFFDELCAFMTSGPIVVQVLEGDDAVAKYRRAPPTPARPSAAPSASGLPSQRAAIRCTAPTAPPRLRGRLH
jgi:nucleoside-diphosphate kinase